MIELMLGILPVLLVVVLLEMNDPGTEEAGDAFAASSTYAAGNYHVRLDTPPLCTEFTIS